MSIESIREQLLLLEQLEKSKVCSKVDACTQTDDPNAYTLNYLLESAGHTVEYDLKVRNGQTVLTFVNASWEDAPTPEIVAPPDTPPPSPPLLPGYQNGSPVKKMRLSKDACCNKCGISCDPERSEDIDRIFGTKNERGRKVRQSWCRVCRHASRVPKFESAEPGSPGSVTSVLMNRNDNIYVIDGTEKNGVPPSSRITVKLRGSAESWHDADKRLTDKNCPVIRKRDKLLMILAQQEKISPMESSMRFSGCATSELFFKVKQRSPELVTSKAESDDEI